MRLADYVAQRCIAAGARHVFLVTGGGAMHLNDAFGRATGLAAVCFHHEQGAAMAAEGYFRLSNRLAVVNVTTGPGGINALNGVYGAYVDSVGMLVISGQVKRETIARNYPIPLRQLGDQEVDIVEMVRPITKYALLVQDPASIRAVMDKALFLATSGRPGPVWLDIPIDVQSVKIDADSLAPWDFADLGVLRDDRGVSPNTLMEINNPPGRGLTRAVDEVIERLRAARRPVLMVGTGLRTADVLQFLPALADKLQIPVVTGWNANDSLGHDNPYFCGRPGTVGDRPGNFAVQSSDFLLVLGCRLNIRQVSYNWKSFAANAFRVMVDVDLAELQKPTLHIDLPIHADLRDFVPAFLQHLKNYQRPPAHLEYLEWCKQRLARYPTVLPQYRATEKSINPYFFIEELFLKLGCDDVIVAGNGSACVVGFQAGHVRQGQRFFTNSGDASMGYDLPAAIGASLANNGKRVICLAGDGSLMMNLQELQTLVGYNLPVKVIVINNDGYLSIRQTQQAYFPDNVFGSSSDNGVSLPDFVALARAFGISACRVTRIAEWRSPAVDQLLESPNPALIEVVVDPAQSFSPKLASRKLDDGTMVSPALEDMAPFLPPDEMADNRIGDNGLIG